MIDVKVENNGVVSKAILKGTKIDLLAETGVIIKLFLDNISGDDKDREKLKELITGMIKECM